MRYQVRFQVIEFFIAEHLPPVTFSELVFRMREREGSRSFVTGGQHHMRRRIGRRKAASGKRPEQCQERGGGETASRFEVTHHFGSFLATATLACWSSPGCAGSRAEVRTVVSGAIPGTPLTICTFSPSSVPAEGLTMKR